MSIIEELETDFKRAESLQNLLIARATGSVPSNNDYQKLRQYFLSRPQIKQLLPRFVCTNRDIEQFWQFIKYEFDNYAERRQFIWQAFQPLLGALEGRGQVPSDESISEALKVFDEESVHAVWEKALARRSSDPEGAITSARTLLETVCKQILDRLGVSYNPQRVELHELYKLVAKELNLTTAQHNEDVFKQILGGCSAIVSGLGQLRNKLGDAHGQGGKPVRPASRHAELAVNLAGSMVLFLVNTYTAREALKN